jgi:hypothetical protein
MKAIEDDAIIIGRGGRRLRIPYRDILSLVDPKQKAEKDKVVPGARVRITAPSVADHRLVGTIVTVDADTLKLRMWSKPQAALLAIPVACVAELDVSTGPLDVLRGAAIGTSLGGGLGAPTGLSSGDDEPGWVSFTAEDKAVLLAVPFGFAGLMMGAVIGRIAQTHKWESVPVDRIRMGISPQRQGGSLLSASFTF